VKLNNILKNQRGAIESIIVTLLLILMGIGLVASLNSWLIDTTKSIVKDANKTLQKIIDEDKNADE